MPETCVFSAARTKYGHLEERPNALALCASRYVSSGDGRRKGGEDSDTALDHVMREHILAAAIEQFNE